MFFYKEKYLKYKNKYLELKVQKGGNTLEELQDKILYKTSHCLKPGDIFHQHKGECWSDSIQIFICFSDAIKISVQQKLFNLTPKEIIEMAYLEGREKYLAPIYRRSDIDKEQNNRAEKMKKRLEKYLFLLQSRLCLHLDQGEIPQCRHMTGEDITCPLKEKYDKFIVKEKEDYEPDIESFFNTTFITLNPKIQQEIYKKIQAGEIIDEVIAPYRPKKLYRQRSEITGIGSAVKALKLINKKSTAKDHGATKEEQISIFNILSFCLLDNNNVLTTTLLKPINFTEEIIELSIGAIVSTPKHATCFYECDGHLIYYNDNYGKIKLDWKKLLKKYIEYKNTHTLIAIWYPQGFVVLFKENTNDNCIQLNLVLEIENENVLIGSFEGWKDGIIQNILFINKESMIGKSDDEIYDKLENQIINTELFNCSISNINFSKLGQEYIRSIMYKLTDCDNKFLNEFLQKINFSLLTKENKDELIKIIFSKNIFTEDDFKCIKLLIDNGYNINEFNTIEIAITKKSLKLLEFLIKNGADVNQKDIYGNNILFYLVAGLPREKSNYCFIKVLVEGKINLNDKKNNETLLEYIIIYYYDVIPLDLIELFIEKGIDINENFRNGKSALENLLDTYYFNEQKKQLAILLINSGSNLNDDLLEIGFKTENIEIIELLIKKGININENFKNGKSALENLLDTYSLNEQKKQLAILLINSGAVLNAYILRLALKINCVEIVKLIIEKGIDVNILLETQNTPLLFITSKFYFEETDVKMIKLLIKLGANVNVLNDKGETPLINIVSSIDKSDNKNKIAKILLDSGAEITALNKYKDNVLEIVKYKNDPELQKIFDDYICK